MINGIEQNMWWYILEVLRKMFKGGYVTGISKCRVCQMLGYSRRLSSNFVNFPQG